jgi:hypothetical protein
MIEGGVWCERAGGLTSWKALQGSDLHLKMVAAVADIKSTQ